METKRGRIQRKTESCRPGAKGREIRMQEGHEEVRKEKVKRRKIIRGRWMDRQRNNGRDQ
jgi:hypothetical protein